MIDDFSLLPRDEPFDPFSVVLFKALQVIAFLFFIALLVISPQEQDGKVDSKAEFLITMDWPDNHPDDIDIFVQDPLGNIVWYRRHEAGFMVLDRDDRGGVADFLMVGGKKVLTSTRQELVTIRGIVSGEYTVNIYHFTALTSLPVPVTITVQKLNPIATVVATKVLSPGQAVLRRRLSRPITAARKRRPSASPWTTRGRSSRPAGSKNRSCRVSTILTGIVGSAVEPQAEVLCLSFAYVLQGVLVLVVLARLGLPRWLKLGAALTVSACYIPVFFATENLLGWSAPVEVPEHFQLLWARVVEPDPAHGRAGAINLWLEALDDANLPSGVPRAYLLPYSPQLASRVADARTEIGKGRPQGGYRTQFLGSDADSLPAESLGNAVRPVGAPGGDPSGGGLLDPAYLHGQSKSVELVPLPPPALPPKDEP